MSPTHAAVPIDEVGFAVVLSPPPGLGVDGRGWVDAVPRGESSRLEPIRRGVPEIGGDQCAFDVPLQSFPD